MTKPRRAAIYCRISNADPRFRKVEDQEASCRELAAREGYEVVAVYVDDGISAYAFKDRPGWASLLEDAEAQHFDVLLAVAEDRFTRQPKEKLALAATCAEAGIIWHTKRDGVLDPASEEGELFAYFRGWMGKRESSLNSQRRIDANRRRRVSGKARKTGARPFGWEDDRITLQKEEAELIRWAAEFLIGGGNVYQVVERFRDSGIPTTFSPNRAKKSQPPVDDEAPASSPRAPRPMSGEWGHASVKAIMTRARNAGLVEHAPLLAGGPKRGPREVVTDDNGVPVVGEWERIISPEQLDTLRLLLAKKATGASRVGVPTTLAGGIARCGAIKANGDPCGAKLNSSYSTSRGNLVPSYRCHMALGGRSKGTGVRHASIVAPALDPMVREAVLDAYFNRPVSNEAQSAEADAINAIYERREKARSGIDRLRAAVREGTFTPGEVAQDVGDLRSELERLDTELARLASQSAHAAMLQASFASLFIQTADEVDLPEFEINAEGTQRWRAGPSAIRSMEREGMSREEAINLAVQQFWHENKDQPSAREELGRRFDGLDLEQRRNLVRSLVSITVSPGRGTERVAIAPL